MMKEANIAVFLGPSLPRAEAEKILQADYYPPATMGDLYKISCYVDTVILVDGVFHGKPSVWHREILDLIAGGIRVLGASSMGALRAAELEPFGMMGYGKVFEFYRNGILEDDDEVALLHLAEDRGFTNVSTPLVDIRYSLDILRKDGAISKEHADELIDYSKKLYYPCRNYKTLLSSSVVENWPDKERKALSECFEQRLSIKREDAIGVLKYAATQNYAREINLNIEHYNQITMRRKWDANAVFHASIRIEEQTFGCSHVLEALHRDKAALDSVRKRTTERCFILEWAKQNGIVCSTSFMNTFIAEWKDNYVGSDIFKWRSVNGLPPVSMEMILKEYALEQRAVNEARSLVNDSDAERTSGAGHSGNTTRFILNRWAQQNGVSMTPEEIVEHGPDFFGIIWNFEAEMIRDLQLAGMIPDLLARQGNKI